VLLEDESESVVVTVLDIVSTAITMGLVATWLSGIGLSSAVPTFQAAGIVTPAALAELDVAHFEALGISDPDDRRKLFYLVQRIKMAVNKKKQEGSVEEQVDAVISGTMKSPKEESNYFDGAKETKEAEETIDLEPAEAPAEERRRSRRIASKQTTHSAVPVSRSKENRRTKQSTNTRPTKANPKTEELTRRDDEDLDDSDWEEQKEENDDDEANSRLLELRSKKRLVEKQHSKPEAITKNDTPRSPTPRSPKKAVVTRSPKKAVVTRSPKKAVVTRSPSNKAVAKAVPMRASSDIPSSRKGSAPPPPKLQVKTAAFNDVERETVELQVKSASFNDAESETIEPKVTTPKSKMSIPRSHARHPVSKLQNPSKSARTGKSLSAIPADKVAPQSPLVALSQSRMEEEVEHQNKRALPKQNQSEYSLDSLLQTASESSDGRQSDAESESDSVSVNSRKSMGSRQSSRRSSLAPPRRSMSGREDNDSKSSGRRSSIAAPRGKTVRSSPPAAFVHGGTEADSWRTKVDDLREDNEAEHELFCGESEQNLYDYDMRIRVIVKKRPGSKTEANLSGGIDVIHPLDYGDYGRILVYQPKTRVDLTKEVETIPFAYDNVFGENSTNVQIYDRSVRNMVAPFFEGQWATVFAYGQTGSGKTYTMMGSNMTGINAGTAREDESNLGLYYLAALDIFEMIKRPEYSHLTIGASLFEIYSGKLFDLVHERKLIKCLEDSRGRVCFPGLTEHPVSGPNELMELIEGGARNRSTGTTSRNADSSRSHAVLQLNLRKTVGKKRNVEHGKSYGCCLSKIIIRSLLVHLTFVVAFPREGRMTFIDLAGSERGADTSSASRATRLEGAEINTSLLALKEVIRALATGGSMKHIPFRGSKLTQVLKDSFVGKNSRCCMVACISPDIQNCDQTLNTLRYSDRVKERNPESGSLAPGYEQPTKIGVLSLSRQSSAEHDEEYSGASETTQGSEEEEDSSRGVDKEADADNDSILKAYTSDDGDTAVLDDLLATSTHDTLQNMSSIGSDLPSLPVCASSKRKAGETLVTSHRSVMSSMLAMVKNEMALVNRVDADRDGLDDYLAELESIQQTQMEYITKLRNVSTQSSIFHFYLLGMFF
jgi:kinesin family protein 2/24